MCEVVGGERPEAVRRVCSDRETAQRLAREIAAAGVKPVWIDGILWEPGPIEETDAQS